jgi:hypothetical protein
MKYNQFLELEKILNDNNITLEDVKENKDVLNEIGVVGAVAGIVGAGLGLLFRKTLLRWGIEKIYMVKLRKLAEKFEKILFERVNKTAKKYLKVRRNLYKKEKELEGVNTEDARNDRETILYQKQQLERTIYRDINENVSRIILYKTRSVHEKIDELKSLRGSAKEALKSYWGNLTLDLTIEVFDLMTKNNLITDKGIIQSAKRSFEEQKKEMKEKLINVQRTLKKDKEIEAKTPAKGISDNIDELVNEKDKYEEDELNRKIKLILGDIINVKDRENKRILYKKLTDEFGVDYIKNVNKEEIAKPDTEVPERPGHEGLKHEEV